MSEQESPQKMLNMWTGRSAQQWRQALLLSLSDMADVLTYASKSPVDVDMIVDWESGDDELPGYLFCFIERLHQNVMAEFDTLEEGTVMQQKEFLVSKVLEGMKEYLAENN